VLRRLAIGLSALVMVSSCEKARSTPLPPPVQQLTEQDTEPHLGALSGDGWRLPLDDRWLAVKREPRQRFKPEAQSWAVDPVGPVHLTVECRDATESVEASLRAQLALGREKSELDGIRLGKTPDGPWLEGALAQWAVGEVGHTLGRFRLLSSTCDVHAWGPRTDAGLGERLRSTVLAFGGTRTGLLRELNAMATWLAANERQAPDAGPLALRVRTEEALRRAPAALLIERFTMRLNLLTDVGAKDCSLLVRHRLQESPKLLERLPEPVAMRWVQVTREVLAVPQGVNVSSMHAEMRAAVAQLAGHDEEFGQAMAVLKNPDGIPDEVVCEAEKVRLTKILSQPADQRVLLLRSLL
jgi:hypothetical protein